MNAIIEPFVIDGNHVSANLTLVFEILNPVMHN